MKPLLELEATDALTARAQTLLRALGPTLPTDARLQRVRRALEQPRKKSLLRWPAPLVLATGLVCASAAAATGALLVGTRPLPPAPPSHSAPPSHDVRGLEPRRVVSPAAARPAPVAASASPLQSAGPSAAPIAPSAPALSDVARVHEAAKALRHDRNPERALHLLERAGKAIAGPLAEEALALRIEASLAAGNGRQRLLAALYLKRYPNGRYLELAQRSTGESVP